MSNPIRPLADRVIIRRIPEADVSAGGIILTTKERPMTGTVVAVGPGRRTEAGMLIPPAVAVDDVVFFGKFSGQEIKDHENEKEQLLILREDEIIGVVMDPAAKVSSVVPVTKPEF